MILPDTFRTTICKVFGDRGRVWLEALPALVDRAIKRWGLCEVQVAPQLSYNFVAFARRGNKNVVLKIGVEPFCEMKALEYFNGEGAVLLLEKDEAMMLLERLEPGLMLAALQDDDATHSAIDVMLKLRRPCEDAGFIQLSEWFRGLRAGPLDKKLVEHAQESVRFFFAEKYTPMLIHGDLHHYNILSSERGWLAVDPKGVVGPCEYEVGPFLLNPHDKTPQEIGRLASNSPLRKKVAANAQKRLENEAKAKQETIEKTQKISQNWAKLIARIYETDPLDYSS